MFPESRGTLGSRSQPDLRVSKLGYPNHPEMRVPESSELRVPRVTWNSGFTVLPVTPDSPSQPKLGSGITGNSGFPGSVTGFTLYSGFRSHRISSFPASPGTPGSQSHPELRHTRVTQKSGFPDLVKMRVPGFFSGCHPELRAPEFGYRNHPELQVPESAELPIHPEAS